MTSQNYIFIAVGDGRNGYPSEAPYDAIHVGAAAPNLPTAVGLYTYSLNLKSGKITLS